MAVQSTVSTSQRGTRAPAGKVHFLVFIGVSPEKEQIGNKAHSVQISSGARKPHHPFSGMADAAPNACCGGRRITPQTKVLRASWEDRRKSILPEKI